jgi:phosphatidylinositol-3-phosphatase
VRLRFLLPLILLMGCGTDLRSPVQREPVHPTARRPVGTPSAPAPLPNVSPTPTQDPSATKSPAPSPLPSALSLTAQQPHIVLIIEENHSFSTVYPSGMPYLSWLGNTYGIATNYYSDEPGSLEDYLWLSSGSGEHVFGCAGWGCLQTITSDNIFRELNRAGLSWRVYAESLPWAGFTGSSSGYYVKRHNPAAWYSDVVYSSTQQKKMVPFTQFAKDLSANALPNYSLIIPNVMHDAHSGTMAMADAWLKQNIGPLLSSPYFRTGGNGVLFITFDNADGDAQGHILTTVIGPNVRLHLKDSSWFRHESTLRTMIELLGLSRFPGASATAESMMAFMK